MNGILKFVEWWFFMLSTKLKSIYHFAPVTFTFALMSVFAFILSVVTFGWTNRLLFSVYRSSWVNPLTYLRLFLHSVGHSNLGHLLANFGLFIIILGVLMERRYGSKVLFVMMAVTSLVTGLFHIIFRPATHSLLGASGIVFMLIFLAAYTYLNKLRWGRWPLGLIVIAVIYFGREFLGWGGQLIGLNPSNVSHTTHIIGGLCGLALGAIMQKLEGNHVLQNHLDDDEQSVQVS